MNEPASNAMVECVCLYVCMPAFMYICMYVQGAYRKQSQRQTSISQQWHYVFQRNFQRLLKRYFAIFPVNFIVIFGLDQTF
jgi:hypothetical protein